MSKTMSTFSPEVDGATGAFLQIERKARPFHNDSTGDPGPQVFDSSHCIFVLRFSPS